MEVCGLAEVWIGVETQGPVSTLAQDFGEHPKVVAQPGTLGLRGCFELVESVTGRSRPSLHVLKARMKTGHQGWHGWRRPWE